jgi:hypothetical protein
MLAEAAPGLTAAGVGLGRQAQVATSAKRDILLRLGPMRIGRPLRHCDQSRDDDGGQDTQGRDGSPAARGERAHQWNIATVAGV